MRPKLRKLNIFAAKHGIDSFAGVLKPDVDFHSQLDLTVGGMDAQLLIGPSTSSPPWWVSYLESADELETDLGWVRNGSSAALLLISSQDRIFAVAFGMGRHMLNPDSYERDFGLRVVVNAVDAARLRSVDARSFEELTVHTRRDLSHGSEFTAFGLDVTKDLIRAVTGVPNDPELGSQLSGAASLAITTRSTVDEIPALLDRLAQLYEAENYKEHFAFIDHLTRVTDPIKLGELDATLLDSIHREEWDDMHVAPPETLNWQQVDGFRFSRRGTGTDLDPDPKISRYLGSFSSLSEVTIERLKRDNLTAVGGSSSTTIESWPVYRCIVFEARSDDRLFALSGGDWYSISRSFADDVSNFVDGLPELEIDLPVAPEGIHEKDYNELAGAAHDVLNLDRKLVPTSSGDRLEICDLLCLPNKLVHVKRGGQSATLSHLFNQGLVSANLLVLDSTFREKTIERVASEDSRFVSCIPDTAPQRNELEVGFAVITRQRRASRLSLPFFSQVALMTAAKNLQAIGFIVSLKRIEEPSA